MLSFRKNITSSPRANKKRNLLVTLLVLSIISVLAWLLWIAANNTEPNKVAILHDDTTQPQIYETVKVGDSYELQATNQPINFIATTNGDIYCKSGDNQMSKISIGEEKVKQLSQETQASIEKVKTSDQSTISTEGGEVLITQNDGSTDTVIVNTAGESSNFNDAVSNMQFFCKYSGEKVAPADLPEFTFEEDTSQAAATVLTRAVFDTAAESNQLFSINLSRYSREPKFSVPTLTRTACIDTIARTWTVRMADLNVLSHNPNFGSQIVNKCKWNNVSVTMGENVGYGPTSAAIFDAFKASPGHWNNILSKRYSRVGIGAFRKDNSPRLFITQNFAGFY